MMQGLKTYCCALCLCEFGCMTAEHRCPRCARPFEYHPNDFHRQRVCGAKKCTQAFGFWEFVIPPRVEAQLRADIKKDQEAKLKAREARMARLQRMQRKEAGGADPEAARIQAEKLFVRGLIDR